MPILTTSEKTSYDDAVAVLPTKMPTVGTIAALRLTAYTNQPAIAVLGYYTAADNIGVREYSWDSVSTEADNGGTIIQVTGFVTGRWKMKYSGEINVKWFGAKADGATDDWAAFDNAIKIDPTYTAIVGPAYTAVKEVFVPKGTYRLSKTLNIKNLVRIKGEGNGMVLTESSLLLFDADVTGIIVNRYNTIDATTTATLLTAGDGSIIDGLNIRSAGGVDATKCGIWLRARARVMNCEVRGFPGDNYKILASAGGGGAIEGNANDFYLENCVAEGSLLSNGFYVDGTDVNAGVMVCCSAMNNHLTGFYDSSFLGNTYVGCHTQGNNQPYKSDSINARNVFLGCYSEGGQPTASSIIAPAVIIGGIHATAFNDDAPRFNGENTGVSPNVGVLRRDFKGTARKTISKFGDSGYPLSFSAEDNAGGNAGYTFSMQYDETAKVWNFVSGTGQIIFAIPDLSTTVNMVRNDMFIPNLKIGNAYVNSRKLTAMSAAPTTETWEQGDIVNNISPTAGGFIGWVCVTGGTPGTWKTYGAISV